MTDFHDLIPAEWERMANFVVARIKEQLVDPLFKPIVDADELAKLLGVGKATVERKTREGTIPSFKCGDLRRYEVAEVLASLRAATHQSTTTAAC